MESSLYSCIQAIQDGDKEQALAFLEKFFSLAQEVCILLANGRCAARASVLSVGFR